MTTTTSNNNVHADHKADQYTAASLVHLDKNTIVSTKKLKRLEATVVYNDVSHIKGCNLVTVSTRPTSLDDHRFVPTQLVLSHKEAKTLSYFLLQSLDASW